MQSKLGLMLHFELEAFAYITLDHSYIKTVHVLLSCFPRIWKLSSNVNFFGMRVG